MTPMELRRGLLMMNRASGSILDGLLEIADSFTPTELTTTHTFNYGGVLGMYILVTSPPGNIANMSELSTNNSAYINGVYMNINKWLNGTPVLTGLQAAVVRPDSASREYMDYWGLPGSAVDETTVTIVFNVSTFRYTPGVTYYLIRVKQ